MDIDDTVAAEDLTDACTQTVLPGDDVTSYISTCLASATSAVVKVGNGLQRIGDTVVAVKAGKLMFKQPNRFYVLSTGKRYVPSVGDTVVGIVTDKNAEYYKVKLNATSSAILPVLAFDGATKRNKPSFESGTLVFARVVACSKFMEPELSCMGSSLPRYQPFHALCNQDRSNCSC